jgi:hypothetical protein
VIEVTVNRGKFPLLIYDDVEDLSGWSTSGPPTVTGSQTDPIGGTAAYLLNDDAGGAAEYIYRTVAWARDGTHTVLVFVKEGTAAVTEILIRDTTAATDRVLVRVTWSTHVLSVQSGNGTACGLVALGDSWYAALFTVEGIIAANTNQQRIYPAGSTASNTGTVYAYIRSGLIVGEPLDVAIAYSTPREGSEVVQVASGVEDAWTTGHDQLLEGDVRWIPQEAVATPRCSCGWDGEGDIAGIDCAWHPFLEFARDKRTVLWVPDRTDSDEYVTSYLMEPYEAVPTLERDQTRRVHLKLRSNSATPFEGY